MVDNNMKYKDAIIFIPGFGGELVDQRLNTIARRMAGALERQTKIAEPVFKIVGAPEEEYGKIYRTEVRSITYQIFGSDEDQPLADIFELDYRDTLTRGFIDRNPLMKVIVMLLTMIATFPKFFMSIWKKGKTLRDHLQILNIASVMVIIVSYLVILIVTMIFTLFPDFSTKVVTTVQTITVKTLFSDEDSKNNVSANQLPNTGEKPGLATNVSGQGTILGAFQSLIVIVTGLGLFSRKSLKEKVIRVATVYVCGVNYLRLANRKTAILGQAASLLEHIAEKEEKYKSVHIVAYSFGTLVALDVVFPHPQPIARIGSIKNIITIGCPYDLVRTYWPNYFKQRNKHNDVQIQWVNLFAPLDVFGSNFRDDSEQGPASIGIEVNWEGVSSILPDKNIGYVVGMQTENIRISDVLTQEGIKIHSLYWSGADEPETNCFDNVVSTLYGGSLPSLKA
jgi:hypothetical protein